MSEDEDDIVVALRRGEDGWEYAAADEIEALRAENAKLRDETLEEAAKIAEGRYWSSALGSDGTAKVIAFAIRAARAAMGESDA